MARERESAGALRVACPEKDMSVHVKFEFYVLCTPTALKTLKPETRKPCQHRTRKHDTQLSLR